jgi:hypothetical protein
MKRLLPHLYALGLTATLALSFAVKGPWSY